MLSVRYERFRSGRSSAQTVNNGVSRFTCLQLLSQLVHVMICHTPMPAPPSYLSVIDHIYIPNDNPEEMCTQLLPLNANHLDYCVDSHASPVQQGGR